MRISKIHSIRLHEDAKKSSNSRFVTTGNIDEKAEYYSCSVHCK